MAKALRWAGYLLVVLLILLLLAAFTMHAQRTVINDPNVQGRAVKPFHSIEVSGGIDLYLSQAEEEALAVSAGTAAMRDNIQTEVINGITFFQVVVYFHHQQGQVCIFQRTLYRLHHFFMQLVFRFDDAGGVGENDLVIIFGEYALDPVPGSLNLG